MLQTCSCSLPSSPSISKFITSHPSLTLLDTKCTTMSDLHQLHAQLIKTGLAKDTIALSRAVAFCAAAPSGDADYAMRLFLHHPNPNAFMWNTLIRSLSTSSNPRMAISLFLDMLSSPTQPERRTFPSLFTSFARLGLAKDGAQLHGMVLKFGLAADTYIHNTVLAMYASCGHIPEASKLFTQCTNFDVVSYNSMIMGLAKAGRVGESRDLFDEMPSRTVATWSTMISAYARNGKYKEAIDLFSAMQEEGVKPNANVLVSLLGACASLGALDQGAWLHAYIEKNQIDTNTLVTTAIIDMYCKCGCIQKALQVFENTRSKSLASWNSMILGLAIHGHWQEALGLFSRLPTCGLNPDKVTFIGILMACGHAGMADEAKKLFASMASDYSVTPEIEHYGCMVDALGRAGRLDEAEDLIREMPMRPDAAIWGALLSGCRLHGNAEMGERAARGVLEANPRDSGGYVLLSNTLARGGEFGGRVDARVKMREEGVRKEPGCSMIEVNGIAHEFVS